MLPFLANTVLRATDCPGRILTGAGEQVASVVPGGPAAQAGLQPGDTATLTVQRNGASQTFQVTLGERPAATQ
jgi:S1-C subfamily serine protease